MYTAKKNIPADNLNRILKLLPSFPVVLVTTQTNIITIGQIHYFTLAPLRIGIAVAHSRYSHSLLTTEREFVVNVPVEKMLPVVKTCGAISGKTHDKFSETGLTKETSVVVKAASIAECGAQIECVVEKEIDFEHRTWFIGKVVAARCGSGHQGINALLCGRTDYCLPGAAISSRY